MIVTASVTTGVARVVNGMDDAIRLIDEILSLEHTEWETTLFVGEVEFHRSKEGPFPNHQLRVSASPSSGYAALNYMDHDDPEMPIANSFSRRRPVPELDLVFNGSTGAVFPRTAALPITDARAALVEWLRCRRRPTCIEWRPYDSY